MDAFDAIWMKTKVPSDSRRPRSLRDHATYKAMDWRAFVVLGAPLIYDSFADRAKEMEGQIWLLYSYIYRAYHMDDCHFRRASLETDIPSLLRKLFRLAHMKLGDECMTFNFHAFVRK